jgi:hypothetical protein
VAHHISISEARGKLPELAHRLVRSPGSVVYIEHRDLEERLALTTQSHIQYLEAMVHELKKSVTQPFTLAGSIETDLSPGRIEASLKGIREEQQALSEAKFGDILG